MNLQHGRCCCDLLWSPLWENPPKKALWMFCTGKDSTEKGNVVCYGYPSIDCCAFVLHNNILIRWSDCNVTERGLLTMAEWNTLHTIHHRKMPYLGFYLDSCPTGSMFMSCNKRFKGIKREGQKWPFLKNGSCNTWASTCNKFVSLNWNAWTCKFANTQIFLVSAESCEVSRFQSSMWHVFLSYIVFISHSLFTHLAYLSSSTKSCCATKLLEWKKFIDFCLNACVELQV